MLASVDMVERFEWRALKACFLDLKKVFTKENQKVLNTFDRF